MQKSSFFVLKFQEKFAKFNWASKIFVTYKFSEVGQNWNWNSHKGQQLFLSKLWAA